MNKPKPKTLDDRSIDSVNRWQEKGKWRVNMDSWSRYGAIRHSFREGYAAGFKAGRRGRK